MCDGGMYVHGFSGSVATHVKFQRNVYDNLVYIIDVDASDERAATIWDRHPYTGMQRGTYRRVFSFLCDIPMYVTSLQCVSALYIR